MNKNACSCVYANLGKPKMSLFSNIFKRKEKLPPADMSMLNADMHSHLIPGIDDGAQTMEDSIQLIKELQQMGYRKLITTPHIMSDQYPNNAEIILGGLEKVREELSRQNIDINLEAAAEYYYDYEFKELVEKNDLLTFGDKYILFELSYINPPEQLENLIFKLRTSGYTPVIAHVERYPFWYDNFEHYDKLVDAGVKLQLNISSLNGQYGPPVKAAAQKLIDKNYIDLLGTDCHNMNYIKILKDTLTNPYLHKVMESGKLINSSL
ncbi:MAG TPA: capsular biosynthesis protein [Flavobacteriales bacterium]|nr:capsular biosynthesis protein [Flavobacteriales bacterium]